MPAEHSPETTHRRDPRLIGAVAAFGAAMWSLGIGFMAHQALQPPPSPSEVTLQTASAEEPHIHTEGIVLISVGVGSLALGTLGGEAYRQFTNHRSRRRRPDNA